MSVLHLLKDDIEKTFLALEAKVFPIDPIAGPQLSRTVSLTSSAYKRHGRFIERCILECLKQCDRYEVWREDYFQISQGADLMIRDMLTAPAKLIGTDCPYPEKGQTTLQIDLIVYDKQTKTLSAYEIKRGGGLHDSGKTKSLRENVLRTQILLRNYGLQRGLDIKQAFSRIIFYYGKCSIKKPFNLINEELDDHFGWPVFVAVEEMNEFFKTRLRMAVGGM